MNKAKWVLFFLLAVLVAVPSYAVELTLGGFPSYFRIRPQFYKDATFVSALSNAQARTLGFNDADDNIVFVDSRLRLTPKLVLSDAVTIRAQVDVMDNTIWGGTNSLLVRDVVYESLTPTDRFRGALLVGPVKSNVLFYGLFGAQFTGVPSSPPVDDVQYFNVRMLHVDIVLPHNLGFIRAGRQPFDWGLGILANGGWDPLSDLGFVLDRFLYLKSWPLMKGTFTFVFVSDRFRQGQLPGFGQGAGRTGAQSLGFTEDKINIDASNLIFAVRGEVYPGFPVSIGAVEFGWANGDNIDSVNDGGDFQGNVLAFSAAYNIDNLLFKHIIPNIYGLENSVINAFYVRGWMTAKLMDHVTFTPQVLFAWNDQTDSPLVVGQDVDKYLGTEIEGTVGIEVVRGVNFDLIGSLVINSGGLKDLLEQQGAANYNAARNPTQPACADSGCGEAEDVAYAFQGRVLVYIDQFFK